jgi:hypothetical protein
MQKSTTISKPKPKLSRGFLVTVGIIAVLAMIGKPMLKWGKLQYNAYKASTTILTASDAKYQELVKVIQANQLNRSLIAPTNNGLAISEQIFQTALSRDLLGRSSQYEPNTNDGKLACARMVNMVIENALGYQVGQNPLYVPSIVEDLDLNRGKRIEQKQALRGDIAIANGTDYKNGQWHIGICMNDGCGLILSNSPFESEFSWLTSPNFDGAFDHYAGKTTFYKIVNKPIVQPSTRANGAN